MECVHPLRSQERFTVMPELCAFLKDCPSGCSYDDKLIGPFHRKTELLGLVPFIVSCEWCLFMNSFTFGYSHMARMSVLVSPAGHQSQGYGGVPWQQLQKSGSPDRNNETERQHKDFIHWSLFSESTLWSAIRVTDQKPPIRSHFLNKKIALFLRMSGVCLSLLSVQCSFSGSIQSRNGF